MSIWPAVVRQIRGVPEPIEVFREIAMCGGQAWDDPERALDFATRVARSVLIERIAHSSRPSLRRRAGVPAIEHKPECAI